MCKHDVDWAPCKNLGHKKVDVSTLQAASDRATRTKKRRQRIEEAVATEAVATSSTENESPIEQLSRNSESQMEQDNAVFATTDMETQTCVDCNEVLSRSISVQTCAPQTCDVGVQTDDCHFFHEKNFLNDDAKVHYYTGLPKCALFLSTFEFVMKPFCHGEKRDFYWRSFIIVFLKLRLNLGMQDIAYRLDISLASVSRLFHATLDVMMIRLAWLIKWPEREELWKTMPNCFRAHYGTKVVAIVDCYEIKIETPSNLVAKSATWSQYKHSNTAKVFIAMCPQGVTTFVSCAWGGRVSDKHLTVNSGFLSKLLPGDIVLADRGFDIDEDVARMQATLQIPAFTRGCAQLSPKDIEKTRQLANVRIHIERVIGATRQKFSILSSCIPIDFVKPKVPGQRATIDKIITICSALHNLCKSVVPNN